MAGPTFERKGSDWLMDLGCWPEKPERKGVAVETDALWGNNYKGITI
jgi:hypothetical protein